MRGEAFCNALESQHYKNQVSQGEECQSEGKWEPFLGWSFASDWYYGEICSEADHSDQDSPFYCLKYKGADIACYGVFRNRFVEAYFVCD